MILSSGAATRALKTLSPDLLDEVITTFSALSVFRPRWPVMSAFM